jgi:hypothetical protein
LWRGRWGFDGRLEVRDPPMMRANFGKKNKKK